MDGYLALFKYINSYKLDFTYYKIFEKMSWGFLSILYLANFIIRPFLICFSSYEFSTSDIYKNNW